MYRCELIITVVGQNRELERALSGVTPPGRFSFAFETVSRLTSDVLRRTDLLILEQTPQMGLPALKDQLKQGALLVLCADGGQLSALTGRELPLLDAVWPAPLSGEAAAFCFQKLVDSIRLRKDCWLAGNYLDTIIDSIPDMVWFKDLNGAHLKVNNSFCQAVGKTKEQCEGRGHSYIWDLDQGEYEKGEYVCRETEEEVVRQRKTCLFEEMVKSKQGLRRLKTYKSPIIDEDGSLLGTVGLAHDVTDFQNMGAEIELILRNMPFAILLTDERGRIVNLNQKFCECFRVSSQDLLHRDYDAWKSEVLEISEPTREGSVDARLRFPDQEVFLALREEPILDVFQNLMGRLCIFQNVTVEQGLRRQIIHNANTDFMSGLYNRRYLYEFIKKHSKAGPFSLLYVDLDHFKQVNDTYGHRMGDSTIIAVAQTLKSRFHDSCVARIGGDEFLIVLLGDLAAEQAACEAQALLDELDRLFASRPEWKELSTSIGIARSGGEGDSIDELIHRSDLALYEAKKCAHSQWRLYSADDIGQSDESLGAAPT